MRLAIFDLDGTVTRRDTLAPFLSAYARAHPARLPRFAAAVPAALRFLVDHDRGRFKGSLIHAVMAGATRADVDTTAAAFVVQLLRHGVHGAALQALERHRQAGDHCVLLSASTDLYVPRVGTALGFDEVLCTEVRWQADRLDGHLASANRRGEEKRRCLEQLRARLAPERTTAYGNARSDLAHLALADEAFLVNGGVTARAQARALGIHCVRWR
jgi:phosphatidylglycerophosphatase C